MTAIHPVGSSRVHTQCTARSRPRPMCLRRSPRRWRHLWHCHWLFMALVPGFIWAVLVGWGVGDRRAVERLIDWLGGDVKGAKWVLLLCHVLCVALHSHALLFRLPDALAMIALVTAAGTTRVPVMFAYVRDAVADQADKATAVAVVDSSMTLATAVP